MARLANKFRWLYMCLAYCLMPFFTCYPSAAYSNQSQSIYVFYPDVREPYKSIFNEILSGIEAASTSNVLAYSIHNSQELESYQSLFKSAGPGTAIALGNISKSIYPSLSVPAAIVSGASLLTTEDIESGVVGISLSPAPDQLIDKLIELAPEVNIISVVYHKETNGWLVDIAENYAQSHNLILERLEATDVRDAAQDFKVIFEQHQGKHHAIWLLQGDPTLDEKGMLPDVLSQAWESGCVVFSSNPSHVKRGALFSLYPDNYAMGKSLALLTNSLKKGNLISAQPVSDLKTAVNIRTAEHLNLNISRSQERGFDLIFPSQ